MKIATTIARVLLAAMVIIFGLNKFLMFIPMGEPQAEMGSFLGALMATGYMFPIVAIIEIVTGVAFLLNKFTALAAIVLFPVMLNAFLSHLFLDPAGIGGSLIVILLNILCL